MQNNNIFCLVANNIAVKIALVVACITLLIYLPALNGEFINYDDPGYVYNNPAIRILDWEFIKWAFTASYMGWPMPFTWISFAIDYQIWGLNPFGYHLTNNILHAVNAGMVVLLADRLYTEKFDDNEHDGNKYLYPVTLFLAGFMWGVHPLNVESVAWVTERKNVLNGVFFFGTILSYLRYTELIKLNGEKRRAITSFVIALLLLVMGLLVKPVGIITPAVLLLIDWYPLGRLHGGGIRRVLAEKIPFLLLCALSAIMTLLMAKGENFMVPTELFSISERSIASGSAVFDYIILTLFPIGINVMYLLPFPLPKIFIVKMIAVVLFICLCVYRVKKQPWLFMVLCCFLLPLWPGLPFFLGGVHIICAHFVYLPLVAPSIAAAHGISKAYRWASPDRYRHARTFISVMLVFIVVFYIGMTERLIASWKNPETLWTRVIKLRPAGRAYYYRADYYMTIGKYVEAAEDLRISIQMANSAGYPDVFNLHALRGDALNKIGQHKEAVGEFTEAINSYPHPTYYFHRGRAFEKLGMMLEAAEDFKKAGDETGPIVKRNRD